MRHDSQKRVGFLQSVTALCEQVLRSPQPHVQYLDHVYVRAREREGGEGEGGGEREQKERERRKRYVKRVCN